MLPLTKRQREILVYLQDFIQQHGYAPSREEIGRRFGLSSLATVHKHLTNLQEKGFIKRAWNRSRSVEMIPTTSGGRSVLVVPVQFLADHLEILYDVDVGAREQAERCGLTFQRIESLNADRGLIRALAAVAQRTLAAGDPLVLDAIAGRPH